MRFRNIMEYIQETPGNTNPVILKQMVDEYVAAQSNELAAYTIDADIEDSVDLLGKKASDLQEGVFIVDGKVFGTLKYVTEYTGFSGLPEEQEGYYLVLHYECEAADSIKVHGVTLDSDGLHIIRMKKKGGNIKVEITKDSDTYVDYVNVDALMYE